MVAFDIEDNRDWLRMDDYIDKKRIVWIILPWCCIK